MTRTFKFRLLTCLAATAALGAAAQSALGQEASGPQATAAKNEVIIVTGTRSEGRSVQDSPVPVDVVSEEAIEEISFTDTQDVLKTLIPSFTTARQPISDGATFIRPASLRGLSSDKTLVLVNSKRRHRAALVSTGGSGTQGPDVSTIPASALKSIEVLRDGAAAQYGSDAIAGVINFILKDAPEGGEVTFQTGQYYEGDGEDLLISGNLGLPLGDNGFVNISVEGTSAQGTDRGQQWRTPANGGQSSFDVYDYVAANPNTAYAFGNPDFEFDTGHVQIWGQPEAKAFRSFVNAGYDITDTMSVYGFANYSNSTSDGDFNYRNPQAGIHANTVRQPDGSLFSFAGAYPAGRTPRFGGNVVDYSVTGGVKGDILENLSYDFSGRWGQNTIRYTLWNSLNPSLGPASPTSFHPGDLVSDEKAVNADFVYSPDVPAIANLDIGFGVEYRDEGYEIVAGDEASYIVGPYASRDPWDLCSNEADFAVRTPTAAGAAAIAGGSTLNCASSSDPVYRQFSVGSDGFPGYPPLFSEASSRDSYAGYVDFAVDLTDSLFVDLALRYENFSDFGETFDYKLAGRWSVTDWLNLRGSVGTGFRAPTPGQLGTTNVSTVFGSGGEPIAQGLFPATNPVSLYLGAKPLDPEKSQNYSAGLTASLAGFDITLDTYFIEISDQFYAVSPITVTPDIRTAMLAAGLPGADTIGQVNFFQNAFDSETFGVDLVVTYVADWGSAGATALTASANYNDFSITQINITNSDGSALFDRESIYDFENGQPKTRGVFTAAHNIGPVTIMGRANYYGDYSVSNFVTANGATTFEIQELGQEVQFDFEVSYDMTEQARLSVGVRNAFDEYPDKGEYRLRETSNGRIYRSDSVVDWQGGFYYGKIKYTF